MSSFPREMPSSIIYSSPSAVLRASRTSSLSSVTNFFFRGSHESFHHSSGNSQARAFLDIDPLQPANSRPLFFSAAGTISSLVIRPFSTRALSKPIWDGCREHRCRKSEIFQLPLVERGFPAVISTAYRASRSSNARSSDEITTVLPLPFTVVPIRASCVTTERNYIL